jgi:hypothetical protein
LLPGDDRLLLGDRLFQLANPLLALGKTLDKIRTSAFHALWNPRYDAWFRNHPRIFFRPITLAAIAGDAARWPGRCLRGSASNRSDASRSQPVMLHRLPLKPVQLLALQKFRTQGV